MRDRRALAIAGEHRVRRSAVVGFFAGHGADDGHLVRDLGGGALGGEGRALTRALVADGAGRVPGDDLPGNVVLVLDGAYTEFAEGYDGGVKLADERPNVLMTRTFSKIYGLGGLRIGWGYAAPEMIGVLNRIRQPFNLSELQMAAAEAAVRDQDWVTECADLNAEQRARLTGALRQLGFACDDSFGNFVLARLADEAEAATADAALQADGILVRRVGSYGFPEGLRITVGDAEQTGRVIDTLTRWREAG